MTPISVPETRRHIFKSNVCVHCGARVEDVADRFLSRPRDHVYVVVEPCPARNEGATSEPGA